MCNICNSSNDISLNTNVALSSLNSDKTTELFHIYSGQKLTSASNGERNVQMFYLQVKSWARLSGLDSHNRNPCNHYTI